MFPALASFLSRAANEAALCRQDKTRRHQGIFGLQRLPPGRAVGTVTIATSLALSNVSTLAF